MAIIGTILAAWLFADFLSGVFHWIEDRYLREDWPVIGPMIAIPNTVHHSRPMMFLEGSYWHRNSTTIIPSLVLFAIAWLLNFPAWMLLGFLFLSQANEIHAYGHRHGKLPSWIAMLQETGILQSARHHAIHHRSPNDVRYCVMSNWLNPWLDSLRFWFALEYLLSFTGLKVKGTQ